MLAPRLADEAVVAELGATLAERGWVRVTPALTEREAVRMLGALRGREYRAQHGFGEAAHQLWRATWEPGEGCEHPLCELGRWLRGEGAAWVSWLAGRTLRVGGGAFMADRLGKGSFFDAYDESGLGAVGWSLQLVPMDWPEALGGYLEVLGGAVGPAEVRLGPAWNALDLFVIDGERPGRWRRMPMVVEHVEGYVVSGWFQAG